MLFLVFMATCAAAAATGVLIRPGEWYRDLAKPGWTPPNRAFPVIWTVLYILIAIAAARVADNAGNTMALALWALQITLNAVWTPVFFGLRMMRAGLVVIAALWLAVALTMVAFFQVDMIAGALFLPYLLWVTVAGALNFSVWRLNPQASAGQRSDA
ncbi:tryptophan-rich sensory protein TspO [Oceaniglobus indicus]|uniref:tryptophan-rich sensory protein TspO n=1 Tax=Oceaniglobus indicus TaxID=2047749 RepID=UPI003B980963